MIEIPIRSPDAPRPSGGLRIRNLGGEIIFELVEYRHEGENIDEIVREIVSQDVQAARQTARALKAVCRVAEVAERLQESLETDLGITVDSHWDDGQDFQVDLGELPPSIEDLLDE